MLIECDTCAVRGPACKDCVVSVMLGGPPSAEGCTVELDGAEQAAIEVLASSGLVPPLRLMPLVPAAEPTTGSDRSTATRRRRAAG